MWDYKKKDPGRILITLSKRMLSPLHAFLGTPENFNKARVLLCLYLTKKRDKKNHIGDAGIFPSILDVGTRWVEW
jgi:hypothetical protein